MGVMTTIDGIPLYSTVQEALAWGISNGLTGYHQHIYKEQVGYMGGETHEIITEGSTTTTPLVTPTTTTGSGGATGVGY